MTRNCPCDGYGYLPRYPDGIELVAWPCPHDPDPPPRIGLWTKLWRWITRRGK